MSKSNKFSNPQNSDVFKFLSSLKPNNDIKNDYFNSKTFLPIFSTSKNKMNSQIASKLQSSFKQTPPNELLSTNLKFLQSLNSRKHFFSCSKLTFDPPKINEDQKLNTIMENTRSSNNEVSNVEIEKTEFEGNKKESTKSDQIRIPHKNSANVNEASQEISLTGYSAVDNFHENTELIKEIFDSSNIQPEDDIENENFEKKFFDDLKNVKKKILYSSRIKPKVNFCCPDIMIKNSKSLEFKKKYNLKKLCLTSHFFDIKPSTTQCFLCFKQLCVNGLGGHMSKRHPYSSSNYNNRRNITKTRTHLKRNKQKQKIIVDNDS
jgi:hypothetical protein